MPKLNTLEIGDMVRVTLPIRDLVTGLTLDRAFEVLSTQLTPMTGEIVIQCIAQPEKANFWFQGVGNVASLAISPAASSIPTGGTLQFTARGFDANGTQLPILSLSWVATGNLTVSSTGLVTAGSVGTGTIIAIVGSIQSNVATVTVTAAAFTGTVASVVISPSIVNIAATKTQQLAAIAYDISSNQINNKVFNWASSNTGVATVPAGPSAAAIVTGIANGTANITATETVSSIASPACAVTIGDAEIPTYTPPFLADSAYQIGTKITSMGGTGGPHTIPNGYNFVSGDYWFDGNVTLPLGSTCTINGTVRIFSLGNITINGLIDGAGRGINPNATAIQASSNSITWVGANATTAGFIGSGGNGGTANITSVGNAQVKADANNMSGFTQKYAMDLYVLVQQLSGIKNGYNLSQSTICTGNNGLGSQSIYQAKPELSIIGTTTSGGSWTAVSGLPAILYGSQSANGTYSHVSRFDNMNSPDGIGYIWNIQQGDGYSPGYEGLGGKSGAGLLLMGRGLYVTTGRINLNGNNGTDGVLVGNAGFSGGGGGGGGGSFIGLAERDINGLPSMAVWQTQINVSGGSAGLASIRSSALVSWAFTFISAAWDWTVLGTATVTNTTNSAIDATPGGSGAIITQVIG
jgi:hypothetical protein